MDNRQIQLVRESWELCLPQSEQIGKYFYTRLIEHKPELAHLFNTNMSEQIRKFMNMLSVIINGLDNLHEIVTILQDLGARHEKYGVKPEHYKIFGETLISTILHETNASSQEDTKEAWLETYKTVVKIMLSASSSSESGNQAQK